MHIYIYVIYIYIYLYMYINIYMYIQTPPETSPAFSKDLWPTSIQKFHPAVPDLTCPWKMWMDGWKTLGKCWLYGGLMGFYGILWD